MKKAAWICVLAVLMLGACNSFSAPTVSQTKATLTPLPEQPRSFEYPSVAAALAALKSRNDVSIEVSEGWTIVTEPDGLTTWSFTPPNHPAHPAVAKRTLYKDENGWQIRMNIRCEADKEACDQFTRDFEAMNEQMRQYIEQQNSP